MTHTTLLTTMRAIGIRDYGGVEALEALTLPVPEPAAGQVLVRIEEAAVNPFDTLLRQGVMKQMMPLPLPTPLGLDLAGVVAAVGEGVQDLAVGTPVFGRALMGSMAEYALSDPASLAVRPAGMSPATGASIPTAAMASWHALHSYAAAKAGETVLVLGGASMTGQFAVQLAKRLGCHVIATTSGKNVAYVRSLGADEVIDYEQQQLAELGRGFDVVLDTVGAPAASQALSVAKPGTRFVSYGATPAPDEAAARGVKLDRVMKFSREEDRRALTQMAQWFTDGGFTVEVAWCGELDAPSAQEAHRRLATRHQRGKLVLRVAG